ncbi:unnamed protein product [Mytilus coruscus]|uniref:Immunoglobulin domain-containing protein n=1 Tax=Mytilus coruscus TaxID=42192 RepID=A0A6J8D1N1_MYTCO|nr:unnamed protein product [Mytilus coruscus]
MVNVGSIVFICSSITGIGNDTIKMKVQKGKTVVLQCSSGDESSWLGPDVINSGQKNLLYFTKNQQNPKLNQIKYMLKEYKGRYDLIIVNFLKENTGCYICRFRNNETFLETRYNVSLTVQKNQQGNNEQTLVILLVMIPIVLLGGSITIVGVLARVKGTSIEQDNTVENQLYQNSNVPPNENSSEPEIPFPDRPVHDADLGVSEDTGATSIYRNTNESTAVKLHVLYYILFACLFQL